MKGCDIIPIAIVDVMAKARPTYLHQEISQMSLCPLRVAEDRSSTGRSVLVFQHLRTVFWAPSLDVCSLSRDEKSLFCASHDYL